MAVTISRGWQPRWLMQASDIIYTLLLSNRSARRLLALVLFFGVWQFLCAIDFNFFIDFQFLPAPTEVLKATVAFLRLIRGCI